MRQNQIIFTFYEYLPFPPSSCPSCPFYFPCHYQMNPSLSPAQIQNMQNTPVNFVFVRQKRSTDVFRIHCAPHYLLFVLLFLLLLVLFLLLFLLIIITRRVAGGVRRILDKKRNKDNTHSFLNSFDLLLDVFGFLETFLKLLADYIYIYIINQKKGLKKKGSDVLTFFFFFFFFLSFFFFFFFF